jgi:hypothetical protein
VAVSGERCIVVAVASVAVSIVAGCGAGENGGRCVTGDGTGENPRLAIVSPVEAEALTVAEVLRRDGRFTRFRRLAAETETGIAISFLAIWDMPTDRPGNKVWTTVFVPTDTAFAALDPEILGAFEDGRLDNLVRYVWLGHHTVHRPYPSSAFTEGLQGNWQPTGVGKWENTTGPSGPVDVELTLDPPTYAGCPILQTDLRTSNGYIHIVGGVVLTDDLRALAG